MTARKLGVWVPGTPEWHAARRHRVGGSDIAALMGWSPFTSRDELLAEKTGLVEPKPVSKAMELGSYLEAGVRDWLCAKHDLVLDEQRSAATWADVDDDRLIYNPDGVTIDGQLVEIKVTSRRGEETGWGRAGGSQIPLAYQAQVQFGMGLLGLTKCRVGVLAGSPWGLASYTIQADPAVYGVLREQAIRFADELHAKQSREEMAV